MEPIIPLLGGLLFLGLLAFFILIPIYTFINLRKTRELSDRFDRLERQFFRLHVRLEARGATEAAPEPEVAEAAPVEEARPAPREPRPVPAPPRPTEPAPPPTEVFDALHLESWLGRKALGWVAVLLLLFATGFFLKYAFENQWIGPLGRVAIGVFAGVACCVAGYRVHRRGWWLFAQMLTAAGVVLLYLTTFASFGYYDLLPRSHAGLFLVALVVEAALLALLYDAPAIAIMAIIGGLLSPFLLSTGHDQYSALFTYLAVLNSGVVCLTLVRPWPAVGTVGLLGTQWLFWVWYGEHYHPEKLLPAMVFQGVLFGLYVIHGVVGNALFNRKTSVEDLVRAVLNAGLFTIAGYAMLDERYHDWMGTLAVLMATLYAALAFIVHWRRPDDAVHPLILMAVSMGFVAIAIPLQADASWIAVGWAVQGLALWSFGLRVRNWTFGIFAVILLVFAVGRLVFVDTPYAGRTPFVPIFNKFGLPASVVALCFVGAAVACRRSARTREPEVRVALVLFGLAAISVIWFVLSVETYTWFTAQIDYRRDGSAEGLRRSAQTALSVVWALYAAILLWYGFRIRSDAARWSALCLFGLTLLKVVFVDMSGLPGLYRVLAFFVLALMMGAAAWGYQRFFRGMRSAG